MPDFDVEIVSGGAIVPWTDPSSESPAAPSRLNPDPAHLHVHRKITMGASPSVIVDVRARVGGVLAPLDAALGGRPFTHAWIEWSGDAPPAITVAPGQTSAVSLTFLSTNIGHHLLRFLRTGGGAVAVPIDVEF